MEATIEARSRRKYASRGRNGVVNDENVRDSRVRRISGRRPVDPKRLEQARKKRLQEKVKANLKKRIALETSKRKAAAQIKEAEKKGELTREEAEKARLLEQAKERLRRALATGLLKERLPGEQAARSQKQAYQDMLGGRIDAVISEQAQSFTEGAVGNQVSESSGAVAEALRDIKKYAGRHADSVMQGMLRAATPGPASKLDPRADDLKRDKNKEGKQTEDSTRTQVRRERARRERVVVRVGRDGAGR